MPAVWRASIASLVLHINNNIRLIETIDARIQGPGNLKFLPKRNRASYIPAELSIAGEQSESFQLLIYHDSLRLPA